MTRLAAGLSLLIGVVDVRRLIVLAVLAAAVFQATPVAAVDIDPYLVPTAPDANGCTGIEIHGQEGLILTLAAWDGLPNAVHCAKAVDQQLSVFNALDHRLVFTWRRYEWTSRFYSTPTFLSYVWETNGHLAGTKLVTSVTCGGKHPVRFVNETVVVSEVCPGEGGCCPGWSEITTDTGDLPGFQPGAGAAADGARFPLYVTMAGRRIAYAANDPAGNGRELWVSGAPFSGSTTMVDINPGGGSSNPRYLKSHGSYATFTADDGHGRTLWRTDGTVKGTYKVSG
jgi:ELWxxDGT repeat protein